MNIAFVINKDIKTSSGNPKFSFHCKDCKSSLLDLESYLYAIFQHGGANPKVSPMKSATEFVWFLNSSKKTHDFLPRKTTNRLLSCLCNCDKNPTGIIGSWFNTNSRKIDKYELDQALDQIRLYEWKDSGDPNSINVENEINELRMAVKKHNLGLSNNAV